MENLSTQSPHTFSSTPGLQVVQPFWLSGVLVVQHECWKCRVSHVAALASYGLSAGLLWQVHRCSMLHVFTDICLRLHLRLHLWLWSAWIPAQQQLLLGCAVSWHDHHVLLHLSRCITGLQPLYLRVNDRNIGVGRCYASHLLLRRWLIAIFAQFNNHRGRRTWPLDSSKSHGRVWEALKHLQ